jgi:hypothetical protein
VYFLIEARNCCELRGRHDLKDVLCLTLQNLCYIIMLVGNRTSPVIAMLSRTGSQLSNGRPNVANVEKGSPALVDRLLKVAIVPDGQVRDSRLSPAEAPAMFAQPQPSATAVTWLWDRN